MLYFNNYDIYAVQETTKYTRSKYTLCCCFLIADVSFIIATQSHTVYHLCKVIGIMLHWSLLAAHMWMLVITFDITSRIVVLTVVTRERNVGKFLKYCIFAFSVPTIIVMLTTIFNETSIIYIGYGKNGICWIKHFDTRIVSYIVPVAFTFIISGIALSYDIYKVKSEDGRNQKALSNSGSNVINISKIALKLVIQSRQKRVVWYTFSSPCLAGSLARCQNSCF